MIRRFNVRLTSKPALLRYVALACQWLEIGGLGVMGSVVGVAVVAATVPPTMVRNRSERIAQSPKPIDVNSRGHSARPFVSQMPSVKQLSDVQPSDWAFQALQSLVERYGIIEGYRNGTVAISLMGHSRHKTASNFFSQNIALPICGSSS
jgi:hypothetical protein